jgi:hypothetical protein
MVFFFSCKVTILCRVFLPKFIFIQLAKKFPAFIEPKGSLLYSQEPTGPYPESVLYNPPLHTSEAREMVTRLIVMYISLESRHSTWILLEYKSDTFTEPNLFGPNNF